MMGKIDTNNKWLRLSALLLAVIVLTTVTAQMGVFALLGVLALCAIAAYVGRLSAEQTPTASTDERLQMRVQSLEMQLADEKAMVAALTNDFEPSDF